MDIPDYAIERMARCLLPMLQPESAREDGKRDLEAWEQRQDKQG